jgi:inorganic pyrophosphatase
VLTQDQKGTDSKVIAVHVTKVDPSFSNIDDMNDIPVYMRDNFNISSNTTRTWKKQICKDSRIETQGSGKESNP